MMSYKCFFILILFVFNFTYSKGQSENRNILNKDDVLGYSDNVITLSSKGVEKIKKMVEHDVLVICDMDFYLYNSSSAYYPPDVPIVVRDFRTGDNKLYFTFIMLNSDWRGKIEDKLTKCMEEWSVK